VIDPPELLVAIDQTYPPLPPEAVKVRFAPAATVAVAGEIESGGVTADTVTVAVAVFPFESVTWTVSVTLPVAPAV
jgi:hypothetical protein